MAGVGGSNRDLWHFVTGSYIRRPPELIGEEIKRNKEKLLKGLGFYNKPSPTSAAKLKPRSVKGVQLEFLYKLSKFLNLDQVQCHDVFLSYLLHDYRGSQKELKRLLEMDRHAQALMLKVRDYYFSERLCLLRCVKHLLSFWQENKHPYKEQYAQFVEQLCDDDTFIKEVLKQYTTVCGELAPTWESNGNLMNERQSTIWVMQSVREQCELLEIVLLFYKEYLHPADAYCKLAALFKKQGFGRRQTNKHLLDESAEPLLHRIGFLQVAILIEGIDLEYLLKCYENTCIRDHHIIKSKEFQSINSLFSSLGDTTQHGPILLMWAVLRHLALGEEGDTTVTHRLGNQALGLRVFDYLGALLASEPFNGKSMVASVCHYVLYNLLCTVLTIFHEETLGDTEGLYTVAAQLLKQPNVSEDFWQRGLSEGVGVLVHSSQQRFPLDFKPLMQLTTALAASTPSSARKVVSVLQNQPTYLEYFDRNSSRDIETTDTEDIWRLSNRKSPYNSELFVLPAGTCGLLIPQPAKGGHLLQWEYTYDVFSVFTCEIHNLLLQVAQGAATVTPETIQKVTQVAQFVNALLTSEPTFVDLVAPITNLLTPVVQRFCLLSPPPLELLAAAIEALTCVAKQQPQKVWHNVQQTGLLPFLTENFDDLSEYASGAGLNAGAYGSILAGYECTLGRYPVTTAVLQLAGALVQPLHEAGSLGSLTGPLLFVSREIFPVFAKWRYYEASRREQVGQHCLRIFHRVLNILGNTKDKKESGVSVRDLCVYSLLFTESGRALLDIISTGVDNIEMGLAQQGSVLEGVGMELIQLVKLAFSVLNRLLILRPPNAPPSPVEHALSTQPANRAHRHVVATIAQYVYHRHDTRLPTLATLLLKRLAMVFPMSILACLSNEAEAIRDMYLARLSARTEDVRLKVVILELLAVCVETQPGLTEMFLNVQPATTKPSATTTVTTTTTSTTTAKDTKDTQESKKDLSLGRTSCLHTVLDLIEEKKQGTYQCPSDLLCAALEFLQALWYGRRETAMSVLRAKPTFWRSVCLSLMRDLPHPGKLDEDVNQQVLEREVKTCANILRILAQELYTVHSDKLDDNLKKVIQEVVTEKRLQYWSTYLKEKLEVTSTAISDTMEEPDNTGTIQLLLAWRNLILVLAAYKPACFTLGNEAKNLILADILDGLQALFSNGLSVLNVRLASMASAFYFTLIKHWKGCVKDWCSVLQQLEHILTLTSANSETLVPSVQIGILGSLTVVLQHMRTTGPKDDDVKALRQLVPVVCSVLQQSTYQLSPPRRLAATKSTEGATTPALDVRLKLQVLNVCLLEELVVALPTPEHWLPAVTEHAIIPCLLGSLQVWIEASQGIQYIHAGVMLLITLARIPQSAEALAVNGLTQHLCLSLTTLYADEPQPAAMPRPPTTQPTPGNQEVIPEMLTWALIFRLNITLTSCLLGTLRYNFLQDAFNFVGVHQERLQQILEKLRRDLSPAALLEVEDTCHFLAHLAHYRREWRLNLPQVLNTLMTSMCFLSQTCVSMLIRPTMLQHVLEKKSAKELSQRVGPEKLTMMPITQRLTSQTSTDDPDNPTQEVLLTQQSLLRILAQCLVAMRQFSPDLCEILLDQSMDVEEYEPILQVGFSTPTMDAETMPTFGTLISATNMGLRLLTKLDPRSTSPVKSPRGEMPIKRSVVMYVLENSLWLIMSQAVRLLREPNFAPRDKQLLKRELSAELNSFLISMQRHLRRGPTSPANSQLLSPGGANKSLVFTSSQEQAYFRLVDSFVKNVLR